MPLSKQGETKAEDDRRSTGRLAEWVERLASGSGPAPVHLWNPPHCGTIDIRIDRDGAWHHEGRRIEREALVRLFARVLRREADGSYVLVTPAEKLTIRVEDVPFLAVDLDVRESPRTIFLLTNLGEIVPLDVDHRLRLAEGPSQGFTPYITVRDGLEARLTRSCAAALVELSELRGGRLGIESAGQFFVIDAAEALS